MMNQESDIYDESHTPINPVQSVTMVENPDHLPPPPPGFQWARLDDVVMRSFVGDELHQSDSDKVIISTLQTAMFLSFKIFSS